MQHKQSLVPSFLFFQIQVAKKDAFVGTSCSLLELRNAANVMLIAKILSVISFRFLPVAPPMCWKLLGLPFVILRYMLQTLVAHQTFRLVCICICNRFPDKVFEIKHTFHLRLSEILLRRFATVVLNGRPNFINPNGGDWFTYAVSIFCNIDCRLTFRLFRRYFGLHQFTLTVSFNKNCQFFPVYRNFVISRPQIQFVWSFWSPIWHKFPELHL